MGSLPVSPPASDQTPVRREFSTDEQGCASRHSLPQTREALQLVRSPARRRGHPDNSTRALPCYAGIKRRICSLCPFFFLFFFRWGLLPRVIPPPLNRLSTQRCLVPDGDRIPELVVSKTPRTEASCGADWTKCIWMCSVNGAF